MTHQMPSTAERRPPRARSARGQSLVEFAIVLPIFLIVIGGAVDLGRLFFAHVATENAAKEGAMYGATNPRCDAPKLKCSDPNTVRWHVVNELSDVPSVTHTAQCLRNGAPIALDSCREGDRYRVTVTHNFSLLTPILSPVFGNALTLNSEASAVVINSAFDPNAQPVPVPQN